MNKLQKIIAERFSGDAAGMRQEMLTYLIEINNHERELGKIGRAPRPHFEGLRRARIDAECDRSGLLIALAALCKAYAKVEADKLAK